MRREKLITLDSKHGDSSRARSYLYSLWDDDEQLIYISSRLFLFVRYPLRKLRIKWANTKARKAKHHG